MSDDQSRRGSRAIPNEPEDVEPPINLDGRRQRRPEPNVLLPHDVDIEVDLIRCAMFEADVAPQVAALPADTWYVPAHGLIAQAIAELEDRGEPVDPNMVRARLAMTGNLDAIGGDQGIVTMAGGLGAPVSAVPKYIRELGRLARARRIIVGCNAARDAALHGDADRAAALLTPLVDEIPHDEEAGTMDRLVPLYLELLAQREAGDIHATPTGMTDLDRILGGLYPGNFIVVGARTGHGKTAFACQLTLNLALRGRRVLYVSREMPWMQLFDRWVGNWGQIDTKRLRAGDMGDDGWAKATSALKRLESRGLRVAKHSTMTVPAIRAEARHHKADCVIVDYLQLISAVGRRNTNRENDVGEVSRHLKQMSLSLDIPVIALAQLNRNLESRSNKEPELYDLRDSGQIEQDSDVVICVHRESAFDDSADPNEIKLLVRKNRHGERENCEMTFIGPYQQILDRAPAYREM